MSPPPNHPPKDVTAAAPAKAEASPAGAAPQSPVPDYQNFSDHQTAAPRPNSAPMATTRKGFIPIPGTGAAVRFGASPRVDAVESLRNDGNPNEFVTSSIPVQGQSGYDGPSQFTLQGKGTRLDVDLRGSTPGGSGYRLYYENDFFGDSSSPGMTYRLRHLYAQGRNFLVGQTFTAFMDADAAPDTVDYEGPNARVNVRQPQIRFFLPVTQGQHFSVSFEQPSSQIDTSAAGFAAGSVPWTRWPDLAMNYRVEGKRGHLQVALLGRDLAYETGAGDVRSVIGWGASVSGVLRASEADWFDLQVAYGEGVARYLKDTAGLNLDAALDAQGRLEAIPLFAPMIAFTHRWSPDWRSTLSYGYVRVSPPESLGGSALRETQYASANLMWRPLRGAWVGLEALWGQKVTMDGARGTGNRINFVVKYDFPR